MFVTYVHVCLCLKDKRDHLQINKKKKTHVYRDVYCLSDCSLKKIVQKHVVSALTLIYPAHFEDVPCQSGVNHVYEGKNDYVSRQVIYHCKEECLSFKLRNKQKYKYTNFMQVMLMRLMSKGEYVIVPKGTKFRGAGKLGLIASYSSINIL